MFVMFWLFLKDGVGRDPDAGRLLRRRDLGTEDECDGPQQGRVSQSHRGDPHRWGDAQTRGETWYVHGLRPFV